MGFIFLAADVFQVMKNLHKACCGYLSWKSMNAPDWKPWLSPDQNSLLEAYDPKDLKSMDETTGADIIDERSMKQEKEEDGNEWLMIIFLSFINPFVWILSSCIICRSFSLQILQLLQRYAADNLSFE